MPCIDRRYAGCRLVLALLLVALALTGCAQANPQPNRNDPPPPPPAWVESSAPVTLANVASIDYLGRLDSPGPPSTVFDHSLSPDGTRLAGLNNDQIIVWDLITGETVLATGRENATRVFFGPDKTEVYGLGPDGTLNIYDAETGRSLDGLSLHATYNERVAYAADDGWLAVGGLSGAVLVWDPLMREQVATLMSHALQITHLTFATDSRYLASAGEDNRVLVWDWQAGQARMTFAGDERIGGLALAPDGAQVAVAYAEDILLIDTASGEVRHRLPTGPRRSRTLLYAPDGSYLVTGGPENNLAVWDTASGDLQARLPDAGTDRATATFAPDSDMLLTTALDARASLWNMTTLNASTVNRATLDTQGNAIFAGDWTADGRVLLLFGSTGPVYIWGIAAPTP